MGKCKREKHSKYFDSVKNELNGGRSPLKLRQGVISLWRVIKASCPRLTQFMTICKAMITALSCHLTYQ